MFLDRFELKISLSIWAVASGGADKKALLEFRLANRDALGWGFGNIYRKGEAELWDPAACRMQFGSEAFVEKYEISLPRWRD